MKKTILAFGILMLVVIATPVVIDVSHSAGFNLFLKIFAAVTALFFAGLALRILCLGLKSKP